MKTETVVVLLRDLYLKGLNIHKVAKQINSSSLTIYFSHVAISLPSGHVFQLNLNLKIATTHKQMSEDHGKGAYIQQQQSSC